MVVGIEPETWYWLSPAQWRKSLEKPVWIVSLMPSLFVCPFSDFSFPLTEILGSCIQSLLRLGKCRTDHTSKYLCYSPLCSGRYISFDTDISPTEHALAFDLHALYIKLQVYSGWIYSCTAALSMRSEQCPSNRYRTCIVLPNRRNVFSWRTALKLR